MQVFSSLRALIEAAPRLPADDRIDLPEALFAAVAQAPDALLAPSARLWVRGADAPPRTGYRAWVTLRQFRRIVGEHAAGASDAVMQAALQQQLGRAPSPVRAEAPDPLPPLAWPALPDEEARLAWYADCIGAYLASWERPVPGTASVAQLDALEDALGSPLPAALRRYHLRIGATDLAENLCLVPPADGEIIQPLIEAYPGISDILEDHPDAQALRAQVDRLVAFGDYLGNGNLWCFEREGGAVWYFDHDSAPMLTRMFDSVSDYLDALMLKCLAEAGDPAQADEADAQVEALIAGRWGSATVRKWMY